MKTEKEILSYKGYLNKKVRESIPDDKQHFANRNRDIGAIEALEWVLKTTPPKRTIFDLGEQELMELLLLAGGDTSYKVVTSEIIHNFDNIEFVIIEEVVGTSYTTQLIIDCIYDFILIINDDMQKVNNQVKLMKRLNEMLNEEIK